MEIVIEKLKIISAVDLKDDTPDHLVISVSYDKGGANMLGDGPTRRGYYLRAIPAKQHDGYSTMLLGSKGGARILVEEASRLSRKRMQTLVDTIKETPLYSYLIRRAGENAGFKVIGIWGDKHYGKRR